MRASSQLHTIFLDFITARVAVSFALMLVKVNGEEKQLPDGATLRQLLAEFKLTPEKVAIELNRRLARSDKYDLPLSAGDEIEIVTFVGGG